MSARLREIEHELGTMSADAPTAYLLWQLVAELIRELTRLEAKIDSLEKVVQSRTEHLV